MLLSKKAILFLFVALSFVGFSQAVFSQSLNNPTYICNAATKVPQHQQAFWGNESSLLVQARTSAMNKCKTDSTVSTYCHPFDCYYIVDRGFGHTGLQPVTGFLQNPTANPVNSRLAALPDNQLLKLVWGPKLNSYNAIEHCYLMHESDRAYTSIRRHHGMSDYYLVSVKRYSSYPDTVTSARFFFKENHDAQALHGALNSLREFLLSRTCEHLLPNPL